MSETSRSTLHVPAVPVTGMGTSSCAPTTSTSSEAFANVPSTVSVAPLTVSPSLGEVIVRSVVTVCAEAAPPAATIPPATRVAATSADSQRVRLIGVSFRSAGRGVVVSATVTGTAPDGQREDTKREGLEEGIGRSRVRDASSRSPPLLSVRLRMNTVARTSIEPRGA